MRPLIAFDLWDWIARHREAFEPPVGNKVIWEDSQFTAMIIRGPNARRDFHVDPSDEIFYMLKGDMVLEYMDGGRRHEQDIREGGLMLVPALTPHAPHRPADTWGLVVEIKRVGDIEKDLKAAIERFDASIELRTCRPCGHVQPEKPPVPQRPSGL